MTGDSAILGSWTTLDVSMAMPFLRSLRCNSADTRVVLFVGDLEPSEIASLQEAADEVVCVDQRFGRPPPTGVLRTLARIKRQKGIRRFYPAAWRLVARAAKARPGSDEAATLEFLTQGLQTLRYGLYLEYLERHPEIARVMITDVRDVVFQGEPFEGQIEGLEIFLEDPAHRLDQPTFNRQWIHDLYGEKGLEVVGASPAACSGVTVGQREPMLRYLRSMDRELRRHWGPLGSHDQGVHNWLLHTGQLAEVNVLENGEGRVLTLGGLSSESVVDGERITVEGGTVVPAVVHQYDRHHQIRKSVEARFGTSVGGA